MFIGCVDVLWVGYFWFSEEVVVLKYCGCIVEDEVDCVVDWVLVIELVESVGVEGVLWWEEIWLLEGDVWNFGVKFSFDSFWVLVDIW